MGKRWGRGMPGVGGGSGCSLGPVDSFSLSVFVILVEYFYRGSMRENQEKEKGGKRKGKKSRRKQTLGDPTLLKVSSLGVPRK